jgi:hypothetical protein
MKKSKAVKILSNLALAAVVSAFAGCASGNYQKGSGTATGLTESADMIAGGKGKVDAVLASLNDLVGTTQGDLVPKFKAFNTAYSDLVSTAKDVKSKVTKMREQGNEYFKKWDEQLAQIKSEDIKSRSAERKAAVQKEFLDIKRSYTEAQMAFQPFMGQLKDVQTALGTDLTTAGVASVKSTVEKANATGAQLKTSMDQLATQFKELGVAMASSTPAPAPAK